MLIRAEVSCSGVPAPIEYAVLRPNQSADPELPLLMVLHGGGNSREYLARVSKSLQKAWDDGVLPPVLAVTPSLTQRAQYMNARDGSEQWEDALLGPFMRHVRSRHGASSEPALVMGPALGGVGALRFAFKHPDLFAGVAALEPSIQPVLDYDEVEPRDRFWQDVKLLEMAYGSPIDRAYWRENHPTAIAHDRPDDLAGLEIYLECGDEDSFGLFRGAEFLHRVLYDNGLAHAYRLVRGADHVGASLPARFRDALTFLGQVLRPPPPDPAVEGLQQHVALLKKHRGLDPDAP
jgi:S-formylglutathione hydrolase